MAEVKYADYGCPESCSSADLPAVDFNECTDAVESEESEITDVFLSVEDDAGTDPKYFPSDWTDADAWTAAIAQSGNGIRHLTVIGDKPLPENASRTISKGRIIFGRAKHQINFDIDDVTAANYELMRRGQCGGRWVIWYATAGGKLYGGPKGFSANVALAGEVLERGEGNFAVLRFNLTWKAKNSPPRINNPMAEAA
jgi:hypothetical protein